MNSATLFPHGQFLLKFLLSGSVSVTSLKSRTFTIAKLWNQPRCPSIGEWIEKLWYMYTMEYYSVIKKNKIMAFAGKWMELENIMLSEISQSQKPKAECFLCGWWYIIGSGREQEWKKDWLYREKRGMGRGWGKEKITEWDKHHYPIHVWLHKQWDSTLCTIREMKVVPYLCTVNKNKIL